MNAFVEASKVEARAVTRITLMLKHLGYNSILPIEHGLQQFGDLRIKRPQDKHGTNIEVKAEVTYTGNLFLETWSNFPCTQEEYEKYGLGVGWMAKSRADKLLYCFEDTGDIFIMDMFELQKWFFSCSKFAEYPEAGQAKYEQKNEVRGRLVPIDDIKAAIKVTHYREMDGKWERR